MNGSWETFIAVLSQAGWCSGSGDCEALTELRRNPLSTVAAPHAEDLDNLTRRWRYQADENEQVRVPAR